MVKHRDRDRGVEIDRPEAVDGATRIPSFLAYVYYQVIPVPAHLAALTVSKTTAMATLLSSFCSQNSLSSQPRVGFIRHQANAAGWAFGFRRGEEMGSPASERRGRNTEGVRSSGRVSTQGVYKGMRVQKVPEHARPPRSPIVPFVLASFEPRSHIDRPPRAGRLQALSRAQRASIGSVRSYRCAASTLHIVSRSSRGYILEQDQSDQRH